MPSDPHLQPETAEPFNVPCPNAVCGHALKLPKERLGRSVRCNRCRTRFRVSSSIDASSSVILEVFDIHPPAGSGASPSPSVPDLAPYFPERIGRFEVREPLGEGAFGRVYRAYDPQLEREVALKVPRPGTLNSVKRVERFLGDAKAAAGLRHPHIVPVFDIGQENDSWFIASAFVDGKTLADALELKELDLRTKVCIARGLAEALDYAHRQGIVHRDVKPDNVMLDAKSEPHLIDFGLAKRGEEVEPGRIVMGTAPYMSPEAASGRAGEATPASDQYSLGATLYEMLCGKTPFGGPRSVVIFNVINTPLPPLQSVNPAIPLDLALVCEKALAKAPESRYPDCRALAEDLRRWLDGETPHVRQLSRVQRLARWIKREPVLSGALGIAGIAVLTAAILGVSFGIRSSKHARELNDSNIALAAQTKKAEENAAAATVSAAAATASDLQSRKRLALSTFDQATVLCEQGEIGQGLAWFAQSLRLANEASDRELAAVVRCNLSGWRYRLHRLQDVRSHPLRLLRAMTLVPAGHHCVVAGEGTFGGVELHVLQASNGQPVGTKIVLKKRADTPSPGRALAIDPAGELLIAASDVETEVGIWSIVDGKSVHRLANPNGATVFAVAVSPAGNAILTGCSDGNAYLWHLPGFARLTMQNVRELEIGRTLVHAPEHAVNAVAFHPAPGRLIALTGSGINTEKPFVPSAILGQARLWDLENNGRPIGEPANHRFPVKSVAFNPSGQSFATATGARRMGEAALWRLRGANIELDALIPQQAEVNAVAFSPDGGLLAVGGQDRSVRLLSTATRKPVGQPLWHLRDVQTLAFSPDGQQLFSGGDERIYRVWSLAPGAVELASFNNRGPLLAASIAGPRRFVLAGMPGFSATALREAKSDFPETAALAADGVVQACAASKEGNAILLGGYSVVQRDRPGFLTFRTPTRRLLRTR